jgi:anthraniloyl-CoA monooxygenase
LAGDAAHTAHFSVGSGTKLALEDAATLAAAIESADPDALLPALARYHEERSRESARLQHAAKMSAAWFQNVPIYANLDPVQFSYSLLTRTRQLTHEDLRRRDPLYVAGVESWYARKLGAETAKNALDDVATMHTMPNDQIKGAANGK